MLALGVQHNGLIYVYIAQWTFQEWGQHMQVYREVRVCCFKRTSN